MTYDRMVMASTTFMSAFWGCVGLRMHQRLLLFEAYISIGDGWEEMGGMLIEFCFLCCCSVYATGISLQLLRQPSPFLPIGTDCSCAHLFPVILAIINHQRYRTPITSHHTSQPPPLHPYLHLHLSLIFIPIPKYSRNRLPPPVLPRPPLGPHPPPQPQVEIHLRPRSGLTSVLLNSLLPVEPPQSRVVVDVFLLFRPGVQEG